MEKKKRSRENGRNIQQHLIHLCYGTAEHSCMYVCELAQKKIDQKHNYFGRYYYFMSTWNNRGHFSHYPEMYRKWNMRFCNEDVA